MSDNVVSILSGKPYIQPEPPTETVAAFVAAIWAAAREHGIPLTIFSVPGDYNVINNAQSVMVELVGDAEIRRRMAIKGSFL